MDPRQTNADGKGKRIQKAVVNIARVLPLAQPSVERPTTEQCLPNIKTWEEDETSRLLAKRSDY